MAIGSGLAALVASAVLGVGAASAPASLDPHGPRGTNGAPGASGAAATPGRAAAASPGSGWAWPLDPRPRVARRFDPPDSTWGRGHRGVDLVARIGQQVRSPAAGTVAWAGVLAGRGVLVVRHADGLRSTFEPVHATAGVGAPVRAGDVVGTVTAEPGHCRPGTCLHWGVLRGRQYLDPLAFLGRARIVLLPL